jgi:hypothetical protein
MIQHTDVAEELNASIFRVAEPVPVDAGVTLKIETARPPKRLILTPQQFEKLISCHSVFSLFLFEPCSLATRKQAHRRNVSNLALGASIEMSEQPNPPCVLPSKQELLVLTICYPHVIIIIIIIFIFLISYYRHSRGCGNCQYIYTSL